MTILVFFMAPAGFTLLYGGLAQRKNIMNTLGTILITYCVVNVLWITVGHSLAFGGDYQYFGEISWFLDGDDARGK